MFNTGTGSLANAPIAFGPESRAIRAIDLTISCGVNATDHCAPDSGATISSDTTEQTMNPG